MSQGGSAVAARTKRQYVGLVTRPCEHCGTDVTRKASALKQHTYCSRTCYHASDVRRKQVETANAIRYADSRRRAPCVHCGTVVDRPRSQMQAKQVYCSRTCKSAHHLTDPTRKVTSGGYVKLWVGIGALGADKSGNILEHRKVMQDHLGRALTPDENVHHKNGVRDDNRLANLELWSRSQPPGQRVVDKIAWARAFLALYPDAP